MSTTDTGGPAFPLALGWIETDMNNGNQKCVDVRDVSHGMDLRDYFAAKAIQGLLASAPYDIQLHAKTNAQMAYEVADAMLAARGAQ